MATHPYYADGWDRDKVYPLLGFSESIFKDQYWGAGYVRKYVSDNSCVDKIIELYEKKEEGTPLFVFNVTILMIILPRISQWRVWKVHL